MKQFFLSVVFTLLLTSTMSAQEWRLIQPDNIYHYEAVKYSNGANNIIYSIWVDSLRINDDGQNYLHLNTINGQVDKIPHGYSEFDFYYDSSFPFDTTQVPQFLQRQIVEMGNGQYLLEDPAHYKINLQAEEWLFEEKDSIYATLVATDKEELFGIEDSVKMYHFTDNTMPDAPVLGYLKVGKKLGLLALKFPRQQDYFQLRGIEGTELQYGQAMPKFKDYFEFSVGDMFTSVEHRFNTGLWEGVGFKWTWEVLEKEIVGDTISYIVYRTGEGYDLFNIDTRIPYGVFEFSDTIEINRIDSLQHPANKSTGELATYATISRFDNHIWRSEVPQYTIVVKTDEEGNWVKCLIPNNPDFYFDANLTQMKPHCGFSIERSWLFESLALYTNEPVHLVIDGVEDRREVKSRLLCYPNPIDSDQTLQISLPEENYQTAFSARLINLSGQIVYQEDLKTKQFEITTTNLQAGTYWLIVENEEEAYLESIIIW